jgi:hypothetical protein
VRRSPAYYFEQVSGSSGDGGYYYDPRTRAWDNMMEMFGVFVIMVTLTGAFAWLIRTAVDYRRWGRRPKVQAESAHQAARVDSPGTKSCWLTSSRQQERGSCSRRRSPSDGNPRAMAARGVPDSVVGAGAAWCWRLPASDELRQPSDGDPNQR